MGMPASAQIASPPRMILRMTAGGSTLTGMASSAGSTAGEILQPQPPPGESEVRGGALAEEVVELVGMAGPAAARAGPILRRGRELAEGSRSRTYQEASDAPSWV